MVDFVRGLFSEPDQAWIPTLGDIENFKSKGLPYYVNVGFDQLDNNALNCPHIAERWDTLTMRFNERYFNRMINAETLERWQVRLQNRYDEIAARYEFAYEMYEMYVQDMKDRAIDAKQTIETFDQTEETEANTELGGQDSQSVSQRNIDTPDAIINQNQNYADSLSEGTDTTKYGRTEKGESHAGRNYTLERTEELGGASIAESIHEAIDAFRDLDSRFVAEFENNFLNIWWY